MVTEVIMPKMGQTMERGKIIKWLKKDGEEVRRGDSLLEIETDKTTIEVEARESGILRILAEEGEEVPIATTIAYIVKEGESIPEEKKLKKAKAVAVKRVKASPLARKIAEEKGIDLTKVQGTGPGGRITKNDVLAYLEGEAKAPSAETVSMEPLSREYEVVPISSMRRAIARKMVESKTHIPHFYVSVQVDMTEAVKMRESLIPLFEAKKGVRLSFTHLLIKAVVSALEKYPQLNATFEEDEIRIWKDVNIGIAVSLEDGLIVPVLRGANNLGLFEIASQASELITKAREKRLREDEFSGGTFTISNMGGVGVDFFIAIINVPETAILATGKISDKPAVVDGRLTIRKMMTMTLSADHRVVDGVTAAKFLQEVKRLLEDPYLLIVPSMDS
ncbi:TPA: 2-oxo acid dehydrogenase subunit E2 [Candidatus Bathyarchaeota archaeon]|nr:2-oxo acid dehydrogenase subunit E2 [Candidatus Bathyarchaeota archaeon]